MVNSTKTTDILFSNKTKLKNKNVKFRNIPVKWSNHRYLVKVYQTYTRNTNQSQRCKVHYLPTYQLEKSSATEYENIHIQNIHQTHIILYASLVWSTNISNRNWTKLEALQSVTLRMVTGSDGYISNYTIRKILNILSIQKSDSKRQNSINTSNIQFKLQTYLEYLK